ncbi:MAG TPA: PDZ domain-containing protein, partial [Flavobacteriaceae bacterium]|nr:PDZ domain-containing protein [Flavobacteriaceae bacterium]
ITDPRALMPKTVNVSKYIQGATISPEGNRVVFQARGELFSVPAKDGYIKNLSQTSGVAERFPAWSPNGKMLAYWSDKLGEYQLVVKNLEDNSEKTITNFSSGFKYTPQWSPDSKKVVFIDQSMTVNMVFIETGELIKIDQLLFQYQGGLSNFTVSWDANSQWVAYAKDMPKRSQAIALFNVKNKKTTQVTSGFYNDFSPSFDPNGKYLYFLTNRHFRPNYSSFDNSFIYNKATLLAAVPLTKATKSPLVEKNDSVKFTEETEPEASEKKVKSKNDKTSKSKTTKIDLNGFENRIVILPVNPDSYRNLTATHGKVIYQKGSSLLYYDLKEREEEEVIKGIQRYSLTANNKKILILQKGKFAIIKLAKDQKAKDFLKVKDMSMKLNPKEEWRQIYRDAWRLQRDYFYDENMHGLDWESVYNRYAPLIEDSATRWDVNFVLGEMIGELNASHSYKRGGDTENSERMNVGYLGADYEINNGYYRIKHIVKGAEWDVKDRSPLDEPGLKINEGDYIIAVNGVKIDPNKEIHAAFQGLGGKTIELTVNNKPSTSGARNIVLKTLKDEFRVRHLQWIESKRKRVEEATNGEAGYIFVTSTGIDGQNELVRQFMGQWDKPALVIDERFNNGGQIPDRFIELLNRKPLAYWAVRDGKDWVFPPVGHAGPKVMLINGWSGSGGDAFPTYFRKAKLGTLIGTRTWGGLIGISGAPSLIDGGSVTVPTFRMYDPDTGEWFKEGYGVEPDIEVDEDAGKLALGTDPQLEKAIEVIKHKLKTEPYKKLTHPPVEKRD